MSRAFRKIIKWSQCKPYTPRPPERRRLGYLTWNKRERTFYMPHQGDRERARHLRKFGP